MDGEFAVCLGKLPLLQVTSEVKLLKPEFNYPVFYFAYQNPLAAQKKHQLDKITSKWGIICNSECSGKKGPGRNLLPGTS